jgi:hypothetical protein
VGKLLDESIPQVRLGPPDGCIFSERAQQKVRAAQRGVRCAVGQLLECGAQPPLSWAPEQRRFLHEGAVHQQQRGGFAVFVEVGAGTTVAQLFGRRLPGARAEDYLIRVNRQPVSADQVVQEGGRVSMTPTKIAGRGAAGLTRPSNPHAPARFSAVWPAVRALREEENHACYQILAACRQVPA